MKKIYMCFLAVLIGWNIARCDCIYYDFSGTVNDEMGLMTGWMQVNTDIEILDASNSSYYNCQVTSEISQFHFEISLFEYPDDLYTFDGMKGNLQQTRCDERFSFEGVGGCTNWIRQQGDPFLFDVEYAFDDILDGYVVQSVSLPKSLWLCSQLYGGDDKLSGMLASGIATARSVPEPAYGGELSGMFALGIATSQSVPEPVVTQLFFIGIVCLAIIQRRKKVGTN